MIQAKQLISKIENLAPLAIKEANDPSGLQLGDPDAAIQKVLVTLDVRPEVVQEAIAKKIDFIFAHHPVMFHPAHNLDIRDPQNKMYADLLSHHITVYAAHTNLDKAVGGMNDWLAEALHLTDIQILPSDHPEKLVKLVVFTPLDNAETMRQALAASGAGEIGAYSGASYTMAGQGRFLPGSGAHPAIGTVGEGQTTQESRIEVVVPSFRVDQVLKAMFQVHPYEEPAYDIIPLQNIEPRIGLGRIGRLTSKMTVMALAQQIKRDFKLSGLRMVSADATKSVEKIAVIGGDGGKFYPQAIASGADVLVTGDIYYHTAHDMLANGLNAIDPGHHIESIVKPKMTAIIQDWAKENDWSLDVMASTLSTEPFDFI